MWHCSSEQPRAMFTSLLYLSYLFKWTWQESFLQWFSMYLIHAFSTRIHFKAAKKIMVCAIFLEKEVMCNQPLLSTIQNLWHTIRFCNIDGGWVVICSCHNVSGHAMWVSIFLSDLLCAVRQYLKHLLVL